jgi:hypothetical protein
VQNGTSRDLKKFAGEILLLFDMFIPKKMACRISAGMHITYIVTPATTVSEALSRRNIRGDVWCLGHPFAIRIRSHVFRHNLVGPKLSIKNLPPSVIIMSGRKRPIQKFGQCRAVNKPLPDCDYFKGTGGSDRAGCALRGGSRPGMR